MKACAACGKTGKWQACARCRSEHYCSKECQTTHWKEHKLECKKLAEAHEQLSSQIAQLIAAQPLSASEPVASKPQPSAASSSSAQPPAAAPAAAASASKYNAILVKPDAYASVDELRDKLMQPFTLQSYGDWHKEMAEIRRVHKWKGADEGGKFYPRVGSDWYWYVYVDSSARKAPVNVAAKVVLGQELRGDVIIVRSGPADAKYPEHVTTEELADAFRFYSEPGAKKPDAVFFEREHERFMRKSGGSYIPGGHFGVGVGNRRWVGPSPK